MVSQSIPIVSLPSYLAPPHQVPKSSRSVIRRRVHDRNVAVALSLTTGFWVAVVVCLLSMLEGLP